MEISDFDHDGKLSKHLGRIFFPSEGCLLESFDPHSTGSFSRKQPGKMTIFWGYPLPQMGGFGWKMMNFRWFVGEAAGVSAHFESTGSCEHENYLIQFVFWEILQLFFDTIKLHLHVLDQFFDSFWEKLSLFFWGMLMIFAQVMAGCFFCRRWC